MERCYDVIRSSSPIYWSNHSLTHTCKVDACAQTRAHKPTWKEGILPPLLLVDIGSGGRESWLGTHTSSIFHHVQVNRTGGEWEYRGHKNCYSTLNSYSELWNSRLWCNAHLHLKDGITLWFASLNIHLRGMRGAGKRV